MTCECHICIPRDACFFTSAMLYSSHESLEKNPALDSRALHFWMQLVSFFTRDNRANADFLERGQIGALHLLCGACVLGRVRSGNEIARAVADRVACDNRVRVGHHRRNPPKLYARKRVVRVRLVRGYSRRSRRQPCVFLSLQRNCLVQNAEEYALIFDFAKFYKILKDSCK